MEQQSKNDNLMNKQCVECGCTIEEIHESFLYECERCINERE